MSTGEFAFINWLRRRTPQAGRVVIGPGFEVTHPMTEPAKAASSAN